MQTPVLDWKYPIRRKIVTEGKIIEQVGDFNVLGCHNSCYINKEVENKLQVSTIGLLLGLCIEHKQN
jgi:hypothetical protein